MFRNRWGALLFVGLTLAGVTTLVGTEQDDGALKQAADRIAMQKAQADRLTDDPAPAGAKRTKTVIHTPDEQFIDPALGEDPTPIDHFAAAHPHEEELADGEQVVIVSRAVDGSIEQVESEAPPAP
jgi:hypothetical protein